MEMVENSNVNANDMTLEQLGVENPVAVAEAAVSKETAERALVLFTQAATIKAVTGVDVMAMYQQDEQVRERILSGALDFIGLYHETNNNVRNSAPTVVRSSNGNMHHDVSVRNMSESQFKKLDEMLKSGQTVSL